MVTHSFVCNIISVSVCKWGNTFWVSWLQFKLHWWTINKKLNRSKSYAKYKSSKKREREVLIKSYNSSKKKLYHRIKVIDNREKIGGFIYAGSGSVFFKRNYQQQGKKPHVKLSIARINSQKPSSNNTCQSLPWIEKKIYPRHHHRQYIALIVLCS